MNKTLLKTALTAVAIFGLTAVPTLADTPVLNILTITGPDVVGTWTPGSGSLTVNVTPTTVNVGGSVTHDPNLNPVQEVRLYVNTVLQSSQTVPNGSGTTFTFSLPCRFLQT